MSVTSILPSGVYRHYKGELYLVLGIAQHSETQEALVVYVPLYRHTGFGMGVRPLEMFIETVEVNGETLNRFEFVGNQIPSEDGK